jgi:hypothetical protein
MESSHECGNEPSGSMSCWETTEWLHKLMASQVVFSYIQLVNLKLHGNDVTTADVIEHSFSFSSQTTAD